MKARWKDIMGRLTTLVLVLGLLSAVPAIPLVPYVKADLTGHTLRGAMAGIFHYLALEEAAIRNDAVKRTTALLQKVFGGG